MEKRVKRLEYEVTFNPPGDRDCFYASAAEEALGIESQSLKIPRVLYQIVKNDMISSHICMCPRM